MQTCIFCKIIRHETSADILYEDKNIIVFKDIKPSAPVHLLVVTKKHIKSINQIKKSDSSLVSNLVLTAQKMAVKQKIAKSGYKLLFNVGRGGGQLVDHLHLHLIGGW